MRKILLSSLLILGLSTNVAHANPDSLNAQRLQQIKSYLNDLQNHNADAITALFVPGGKVLSTSQGNVDASQFFHSFLPKIKFASVSVQSIYKGIGKKNEYSASFGFNWILNDGSKDGAVYEDEFIFEENSALFKQVIMYENTKGL